MRRKAGGFLFRGQEENSYKPMILESKLETQRLSKCSGSTPQLELQYSHQERYLITDTSIFPQQGEEALILPRFLSGSRYIGALRLPLLAVAGLQSINRNKHRLITLPLTKPMGLRQPQVPISENKTLEERTGWKKRSTA